MADLDDLINQIPIADIAERLGVDEGEVSSAVRTLVPTLVGGIQHNVAAEDIDSRQLESAVTQRGAGDLVDGGVSLDQVDEQAGRQEVARIFGGNDTSHVASALSNAGAGNSDLLQKLLPIITPIVLSYIANGCSRAVHNPPRSHRDRRAASATFWAASSAAGRRRATTRWATSWAMCWATRAPRSATFSAD